MRKSSRKTNGKRSEQPLSATRPQDGENGLSGLKTTSGARQMTSRSASEARESVPPEPGGLRGRGGERPFSNCESARSAAHSRKRRSEMTRAKVKDDGASAWEGERENRWPHKTTGLVWKAVFRYNENPWKCTSAETEKKLKDLSAISGRATDELVEDAMAGYFAEVQQIRQTLNGRYDDLKSGKVRPISGDEIEAHFREKSAAARSEPR